MCSLALLHPWFPPSKAPLKIGRSWVQFLLMTEWKNQIFSEDFNFFDISPRAKCVLLLFYILDFPFRKHPWRLGGHEFNSYSWQNEKIQFSPKISTFSTSHRELNVFYLLFYILDFPLSKAPLKIGRSWVQFLLMTEWKNQIFSEDFNFFDISPRAKCVLLLFYILDFPLRKHPWRLGGHEFNSYSWQNEKIQFSPKISTFSTSHRELNVFFCSFTSLISPFESTLKNWVMSHDRMKKSNFLSRFQPFRPRAKCVLLLFYILDFPFRKHPWRLGGHEFNSYSWQNEKIQFSPKISTFSTSHRELNVFFALLHPWFPPSKAPLKIRRSWVQFLLMTEWKNPIFSEDFNFFDISPRAKCVLLLFYILDFPLRKHP